MIRPGETWGRAAALPHDAPVVSTDRELALLAEQATAPLVVGVLGGDLHRTLGAPPPERMHTEDARHLPVDLLVVRLDGGTEQLAAAHVIVGASPWFRRRTIVAMNAAFAGSAYLGPRSHPNDGLVDLTDGALGWWEQRRAAARWGSGAHLPHPALRTSRVRAATIELDRPVPVALDGVAAGSATLVEISVRPDAVVIVA